MSTYNINYIDFINDYKSITYTDDNICNYLDCILYLDYDKTDEYCDYIINTHIINHQFLTRIKHHDIVADRINNIIHDNKQYHKLESTYINKYECFGIFRIMLEDTVSNIDFINKEIDCYIKTNNIDIDAFLTDYKSIEYNEETINNYINMISHFNYDKTDEFIDYIINTYVINQTLFTQLKDKYYVINKIKLNLNIKYI